MVKILSEDYNIKIIAESGQCFRISESEDPNWPWRIISRDKCCYAKQLDFPEEGIALSCSSEEYEGFWKEYFDGGTDYAAIRKAVDPNDLYLTAAAEYGKGIRILKQDRWEMLISFIISQQNNIPKITRTINMLCEKFGTPMDGGLFAFPTPEQLSKATPEELKACALGYRAPYISEAAISVCRGDLVLEALDSLSYEELMKALLKIKGVGPKVANCIALFAYHRISAFPVDVWIKKVLDEHYGGSFPLERYPDFAGVLQQYLFYYARTRK